jgi:hypothetical protein
MVALGVIGIATGIFFKITGIVIPKIPPFGFINRTLGIVPGVVKGAMIASVVLAPILAWDGLLGAESPVSDSVLARPVVESVNRLTSGALVRAGVDPAAATGVMAQP